MVMVSCKKDGQTKEVVFCEKIKAENKELIKIVPDAFVRLMPYSLPESACEQITTVHYSIE